MILLNKVPPFSFIEYYLIKFIGIPVFVAWFFTRKTLDGKAPHRFLLRYLEYQTSPKMFARYQAIPTKKEAKIHYEGVVAFRRDSGGESNGNHSVSY
jgi:hypothetical protein